MKKLVCMVLCILLLAGLLSGCGTTLEGEESVVYVDKKGAVSSLDVETLDADYYDASELETFVKEAVAEYTEENGRNAVKLESLTAEDGKAKLKMKYKTAEDYAKFNGIELYQGKVVDSLAAGYIYDGDFASVKDGAVAGSATKQEIYAEENLKVVIIRANTNVRIDGEICYVSCENVKLTGPDSVSIREGYYLENGNGAQGLSVEPGTEQMSGDTQVPEAAETGIMTDTGSFETEVYTFIVYK